MENHFLLELLLNNSHDLWEGSLYQGCLFFMQFPILKMTENWVAINKPCGYAVHRSKMTNGEKYVLQDLRNQLEKHLYPVHRLDVGTSGVLIFALNSEMAGLLGAQFREQKISKKYLYLARGWLSSEYVEISKPLKKPNKLEEKNAVTYFTSLEKFEWLQQLGKFKTTRVHWGMAEPKTGVYHQIRRHANRLNIPLIGDRMHGDNRYNHFFKENFKNERLALHCNEMTFNDEKNQTQKIKAPLGEELENVLSKLRELH